MSALGAISRADAGFGIVELLVALAIAAAVAVGIGGLVAFGAQVRDRAEITELIEGNLASLMALSSTLERLAAMQVSEIDDEGFVLRQDRDDTDELTLRLIGWQLIAAAVPFGGDPAGLREASRIDLGAFAEARLEYLIQKPGSEASWMPAPQRPPDVLAARVVVTRAHRSWPVILWALPFSAGVAR